MRSTAAAALLWGWIMLNSAMCSVSASGASKEFIDEIVREHNKARSSVKPAASDMKDMTWDDSLAIIATEWAGRCLFEHNPDPSKNVRANPNMSSIGENIWTSSSSVFSATLAIQRWVDEKLQYDYSSNTCSKMCGHYTQVVWASSNKVGCGVNLCRNGVKNTEFSDKQGYIFVCNYAPAGNIVGMRPYLPGEAACSDCEGPCDGRPCPRSAGTQDEQIFVTASNLNYVVILIVRPLGLIATFLAAYAVRHFYPNVFCYE